MNKRILLFTAVLTIVAGGLLVTLAQDQAGARVRAEAVASKMAQEKMMVDGEQTIFYKTVGDTFTFIAAEGAFGGKVVKGAPYSAEAISENIQVLQDGNRIVRKNSAALYRDGQGRTRTEQTLRSIGPYASAGDSPQTFFIFDPVASVRYTLEPTSKVARKMDVPRIDKFGDGDTMVAATGGVGTEIRIQRQGPPAAGRREDQMITVDRVEGQPGRIEVRRDKPENLKTEALGKQVIEGLEAEGTRTTFTIPAGEIGNEQPINIVTEVWYSPELQVVVLNKHTDPRQGEMIYRLTNIKRVEPDPSLFEVPANYTIKEALPSKVRMNLEQEIVREKIKKEKNNQ